MTKSSTNILLTILIIICIIAAGFTGLYIKDYLEKEKDIKQIKPTYDPDLTIITQSYVFSEPVIDERDDVSVVSVKETNLNSLGDGIPVIPVNVSTYELTFGSNIINVTYDYSKPQMKQLNHILSYGSYNVETDTRKDIYNFNDFYPSSWMSYHTGGGLSKDVRTTFLVVRANPVRYAPGEQAIHYITHLNVTFVIDEPKQPLIEKHDDYELLIITPTSYEKQVEPLVEHKNQNGIDTKLVTTEEIYNEISEGEDDAEHIKYFIKDAIEDWGIKYVLLIGGLKRQTSQWMLPIRYSYVIPPVEQEFAEPKFITDLYFSDIYDASGNFSSWNTNENEIFSEWLDNKQDAMDLYPDVYVGRLACRNIFEVRTMVSKIISYEEKTSTSDPWFQRLILIGGDSYPDENQYNEGENICDQAATVMPSFDPVKIYASDKLTSMAINRAINKGAGFLYFCGHGGVDSWGTHNPPNAEGWAPTFWYKPIHMKFLHNKNKYPVAVIGGCLNGKFDISIMNSIQEGKYATLYQTQCWAWALTSEKNGGSIATIANSGLGTHGRDDNDYNDIIDYQEVLDGWMELRFLELYGMKNQQMLGDNMGQTITEYLNRFYGNNDKMDTKMVQQWILFGDPSLKIGGY